MFCVKPHGFISPLQKPFVEVNYRYANIHIQKWPWFRLMLK